MATTSSWRTQTTESQSFCLPVSRRPHTKEHSKNGRLSSRFLLDIAWFGRKIIFSLSLDTKQGKFSGASRHQPENQTLGSAVGIHLLNILDGLPHEIPAQKVLPLSFSVFSEVVAQQISNRMIALMVRFQNYFEEGSSMLIVWDWRVGEVVSDSLFSREADPQPRPRYSSTLMVTRISAMRFPTFQPSTSWKILGSSLCLVEVPALSCSFLTRCFRETGRF